jgi:hypothetical protein
MLQQGIDIIVKPLTNILIASIAFGYIPKAWRKVRVIFIPKPGKATRIEKFTIISLNHSKF